MATKFQLITGVYETALQQVTNNPAAWTAFLRSACRNYKLPFNDQILIYAQRPDATAVLEIEKWNKQFGRWVNKGATGIAVFDDELVVADSVSFASPQVANLTHSVAPPLPTKSNDFVGALYNYRLKHYFDISDTHESRFSRSVPLWNIKPEYEAEVIESLENSFGELDDKSTLADAIVSAARNAVEDNMADYLTGLMNCLDGSVLEEFDDNYIKNEYRFVVHRSVAYMMLTRCGIDADKYLSDFRPIANFNTRNTVNALGVAASDIAEMGLREIAATVLSLQKAERAANRTFENIPAQGDNINENTITERSVDDGSADISDGGRLSSTQSGRPGGSSNSAWQVRITPKEALETAQQDIVRESADIGQAERTPDGDRADGQRKWSAPDLWSKTKVSRNRVSA